MPLLPLSRYDIALGKVENPLDDPLFPLTVKKIKFIFDWLKEYVEQNQRKHFRSRYAGLSEAYYSMGVKSEKEKI